MVSERRDSSELQGHGRVEVNVVPSNTHGHIFLRLLGSGHPVSVHLSAQEVRELVEQMREGLEESMREPASAGGAESSLYRPHRKPSPSGVDLGEIDRRVRAALRQNKLDVLVHDLYREGWDERDVYGVLDRFRAELRTQDCEMEEDAVLDMMDRIMGFCSPQQQLRRNGTGTE